MRLPFTSRIKGGCSIFLGMGTPNHCCSCCVLFRFGLFSSAFVCCKVQISFKRVELMSVFEKPFTSAVFQIALLPFVLLLICFLVAKATQHKQSRLFSFSFVYFDCFYLVKHQKGSWVALSQQGIQCACVITVTTVVACVSCCLVCCSVPFFIYFFLFPFLGCFYKSKKFL